VSADGRYVALASSASNLVTGDTNESTDVFVHDRATGETVRVSVASDGSQADAGSTDGSLSADGRYVIFNSSAANLVAGDTNLVADVFVHDRVSGETVRVSVASDGSEPNGRSGGSAVSADGRYVAFQSTASNLVPNDTNGSVDDVFVHDRATGETRLVNVSDAGMQATGSLNSLLSDMSADGRYVVFASAAGNLVPGDTNNATDIFIVGGVPAEAR
jgi:Tol biopolymer transport system component